MLQLENNENWLELQKQYQKLLEEAGIKIEDTDLDEIEKEFGLLTAQDLRDLEKETIKDLTTQKIYVKKVHPDAIIPEYAYPTDSGFDLYSIEQLVIPSQSRAVVKTGLSFEFGENLELQIRPKSGLALNHGLTVLNTPGTVDSGYRGEVMVILYNAGFSPFFVEKGMKIAQGCLCPVITGKYASIKEVDELSVNDRGDNGFGSTGIK